MSAPTALDAVTLAHGIAVLGHRERSPLAFLTERRAQDPISLLSREHDDVLRQAVDPDEIAAALESAGINDRRARIEFGAANTFDLAEVLWRRAPWRPDPRPEPVDRWRLPLWRALMRGALYILPSVLAALALGGRGVPTTAAFMLLIWTAFAICAGQFISVLGHLLITNGFTRALSRLAGFSLAASGGVMLLGVGLAFLLGGDLRVVGVAAGQLVFIVAATLLIVQRRDVLLLATICPGLLLAGATLFGYEMAGARASTLYLVAAAATMGLGACSAVWAVCRTREGGTLVQSLGPAELALAATVGVYGVGIALLTSAGLLPVILGRHDIPMSTAVLATLPLTLTLGFAEFLLHRCRSRCGRSMLGHTDLRGFRSGVSDELRAMVGSHVLLTFGVAWLVLTLVLSRLSVALVIVAFTYALLGVALLLCTTLVSIGEAGAAAQIATGGGVLLLAVSLQPWLDSIETATVQFVIAGVLVVVAYMVTMPRFLLTATHR